MRAVSYPPYSAVPLTDGDPPRRVITRTTAPIALEPKRALWGPRTISIRSTLLVERWPKSKSPPNGNTPVTAPVPPVAVTVSPGTLRSASAIEWICLTWSSAFEMIVVVDDAWDRGISTCAAETTTDSDTALTVTRRSPSACASAEDSIKTGRARNPSAATRSSNRPLSGSSMLNSPSSFVVAVIRRCPLPAIRILAPAMGRSSGSRTLPVTGAASANAGSNRDRTNVQMNLTGLLPACSRAVKRTARRQVSWLAGRFGISCLPGHFIAQWFTRRSYPGSKRGLVGEHFLLTVAAPHGNHTHFAWPPGRAGR